MRAALLAASYDEASVCRRTGIISIFEFLTREGGRTTGTTLNDTLDALVCLLLDGETMVEDRLRSLLPADLTGALEALGILVRREGLADPYYATVMLYPIGPLYIVTDRWIPIDGSPLPADAVFSGLGLGGRFFLSSLPDSPCDSLLDLCAGAGVAALLHASQARHAWACDLSERSVAFSRFNCRLNGTGNVDCLQGDMYAPVAGLTFDRIVAHPPYVPAAGTKLLYRDGGADGEQILRRVIEDLPGYLRPGGRLYCFSMMTDREGESIEQRLRRWLGARAAQFDVMVVGCEFRQKRADRIWLQEAGMPPDLDPHLNITGVMLGTAVIERIAEPRQPVTARTLRSPRAASDAVEWFANWHTRAAASGFDRVLLASRPHMAPRFRLRVEHAPVNGSLVPAGFELRSDYPFSVAVPCPGWMAVVVAAFDGKRTVLEVFEAMREQRAIDAQLTADRFLRDIRELIARGFLELDEFPLPALKDLHG